VLEVNCEICVPEAHNYDGTDFGDVAELASERQKELDISPVIGQMKTQ